MMAAALLLATGMVAGCGSSPSATGSTSSGTAATSTTAPSATSALAGFIAAARRMDADLRTAADSINGGMAPNADQLITCLGHGSQAAADFPADLLAVEQLAASRPPAGVAPASSRAAAEVAVLVSLVDSTNATVTAIPPRGGTR